VATDPPEPPRAEGRTSRELTIVVNTVSEMHWIATNSPVIVALAEVIVTMPSSENICLEV
jgi:hypothetical protein